MNLLLKLTLLVLLSCGNSTEFKEEPPNFLDGGIPLNALTFEQVNEQIMLPHCIRCHANYDQYDTVFNQRDQILDAVLTGRMPKNAPALEDNLKALLAQWVDAGAPRGAGGEPPEPPAQLEATWDSLAEKVFFPKCIICHQPGGQASFLDLSDRQAWYNQRADLLNNLENPTQSFLYEVLTDPAEPMPPAWAGFEPLSEEEIEVINEWIELGLPNSN